MLALDDDRVRWLRLRAQRLLPDAPLASVDRVVGEVGGLQGQDPAAAALGARARGAGFTAACVERARVDERSIITTWLMRGTLHLIATEALHWLLPLLGPVFVAGGDARDLASPRRPASTGRASSVTGWRRLVC